MVRRCRRPTVPIPTRVRRVGDDTAQSVPGIATCGERLTETRRRSSITGMRMLSFRVATQDAVAVERWARRLGIGRSEFLREALRRRLSELSTEQNGLAQAADWGPAEDWTDWADATR